MSGNSVPKIGIEELDEQHEEMARLREAIRDRPSRERSNLWLLLMDLFRSHFRLESSMMREDGHPDARLHERDHDALLARMDQVAAAAWRGEPIDDSSLDFLAGWMESHLRGPDTSLAEFRLERELWTLREESQWEAFDLTHPD